MRAHTFIADTDRFLSSSPSIVLGLDLGTRTGWAIRKASGKIISGMEIFDVKRGESPGIRFLKFTAWLSKVRPRPDVICYESPHHRGGHTTVVLVGFETHLQSWVAQADLPIQHMSVHSGTLKKFATGHGNSSKPEMMKECLRRTGIKVSFDDEADAIWCMLWAEDQLGLNH